MEVKKIRKAEIRNCYFLRSRLGITEGEQREHNRKLHLAMLLSECCESNVKIVFNTIDGYKEVASTVWGATENSILLHGGDFVPLASVACVTLE